MKFEFDIEVVDEGGNEDIIEKVMAAADKYKYTIFYKNNMWPNENYKHRFVAETKDKKGILIAYLATLHIYTKIVNRMWCKCIKFTRSIIPTRGHGEIESMCKDYGYLFTTEKMPVDGKSETEECTIKAAGEEDIIMTFVAKLWYGNYGIYYIYN